MKALAVSFFVALAALAGGCSGAEEGMKTTQDATKATLVTGTYQGVVPCADCEGIAYRLQLNPDFTWTDSRTYKGRSEEPSEESGEYAFSDDGMIVLDRDGEEGMKYFRKTSRGLLMLDIQGKEITGNLAAKYVLTPVARETKERTEPIAPGRDAKLREEGVDFVGFGNEPAWSVTIDDEKGMTFSGLGLTTISTPPVKPNRAQDANVLRYRAVTEANELIVTITGGECADAMSGEKFTHKVRVQAKATRDKTFREYGGCGRYIADARFAGTWNLVEVGGKKVAPAKYSKGTPSLEFNLDEGRAAAFAGCNRMTGTFTTEGNTVRFGKFASTMMSCPDMALESALGKALTDRSYTCKFTDTDLVLTGRDGTKIVCRKPE
jgi:heat shock protein HslJ/uncharacterized lipoprotein NlpE involved in copper resistance